jgi:hypothetical protein
MTLLLWHIMTCTDCYGPMQIPVLQLLGHLCRHLLASETAAAQGSMEGSAANQQQLLPESTSGSFSAALPAIISYMANGLNSLNPAVRLESAKVCS